MYANLTSCMYTQLAQESEEQLLLPPPPLFPQFFGRENSLEKRKGIRVDSQSFDRCNHCAVLLRLRGYVASPNYDVFTIEIHVNNI